MGDCPWDTEIGYGSEFVVRRLKDSSQFKEGRSGSPALASRIMSDQTHGDPALISEIKGLIHKKGKITFAEFMEMALYYQGFGYYTSSGERRDYLTSPCLHPILGRLLAKQIYQMWEALGRVGFTLVEVGAGRGNLSLEILRTVRELYPGLYNSIGLKIVEISPPSMEEAKGLFRREGLFDKVSWYPSIDELRGGMEGCIISNEFIDALPVHVVTQIGDRLLEVYVGWDGDGFVEIVDGPSSPRLQGYFDTYGIRLVEGQRGEVNLRALDFIERIGRLLDKGFVVTIDYGLTARELYSPDRRGSLMCYYRHTMNDNPYQRIGYQDITTHVDFTGLARWGSKVGLEVTGFTNQLYFLMGLGILDEFQPLEDINIENLNGIRWNQGLKEIIMPGGMGDTFKVLIQHKGIERPTLAGFSFRDLRTVL